MPWIDAFVPAEAQYRAEVMAATWGHLAPRKNKSYRGAIVFAIGCFDSGDLNPTPIACSFDGLDDSPWLYDAIHEFLQSGSRERYEVGGVYRFVGKFRNYAFIGEINKVFDGNMQCVPPLRTARVTGNKNDIPATGNA